MKGNICTVWNVSIQYFYSASFSIILTALIGAIPF